MNKYLYVDSEGRRVKTTPPIFEVIIGNPVAPKHVYRIWADGSTEGFDDGNEHVGIRNRIPLALHEARSSDRPVPLSDGAIPRAT